MFKRITSASFLLGFLALNFNPTAFSFEKKTTITDDFQHDINDGKWAFAAYQGKPPILGENKGRKINDIIHTPDNRNYLKNIEGSLQAVPIPVLSTNVKSESNNSFTGNYIKKNVVNLSVDIQIFDKSENLSIYGRTLYLILTSGQRAAYFPAGKSLMQAINHWETYEFNIPKNYYEAAAQDWRIVDWPIGKECLLDRSKCPRMQEFDDIIAHVTQVSFSYGDPSLAYLLHDWNLAATNIRIVETESTPSAPLSPKISKPHVKKDRHTL